MTAHLPDCPCTHCRNYLLHALLMREEPMPEATPTDGDPVDLFQRLATLEMLIKRDGLTPGRVASRANLHLAIGDLRSAGEDADYLLKHATTDAEKQEALAVKQACMFPGRPV